MDGGTVTQGEFGEQNVFSIKTRNGEKNVALNQKSINVLVDSFGADSMQWIGKPVRVLLQKAVVAGKKTIIAYFVTEGWYLDDFGDLTNVPASASRTAAPADPAFAAPVMPQSVVDAQGIDPKDIPF